MEMTSFLHGTAGISFGVASAFTPPSSRGKGYAGRLISEVMAYIQSTHGEKLHAFILNSEVDPRIYEKIGFLRCLSFERVYLPQKTENVSKNALLTSKDIPGNVISILTRNVPRVPFVIWPTGEQLQWHFEWQNVYYDLLEKTQPVYCGAQVGASILLCAAHLRSSHLKGLLLISDNPHEVDVLISLGRHMAGELGLTDFRLWESEPFQLWSELKEPGMRVLREDGVAMIRPCRPGIEPSLCSVFSRSIWV
jgi:hypothetical protein